MRHSVGLDQRMDMLQPPHGVRHFLLLAAVQNQNQAVHIQRDVALDHCRTGVETKDRSRIYCTWGLTDFKCPMCDLLPEINFF